MSKYIPSDKLIAEIERLKERAQAERVLHPKTILSAKNYLLIKDYDDLLSIITSLQQEVDLGKLDKEVTKIWGKCAADPNDSLACFHIETFIEIAHHFYELGLSAGKEE